MSLARTELIQIGYRDRIYVDRFSLNRYVRTFDQSADILTERSFTSVQLKLCLRSWDIRGSPKVDVDRGLFQTALSAFCHHIF